MLDLIEEKNNPELSKEFNEISDIKLYNRQMSASMADKLFFLDLIDPNDYDTIVDFGCADGELLKQHPIGVVKIGVDNSEDMRKEAKLNYPDCSYVNSLDDLKDVDKTHALFNASSVIHEIYSYLSKDEIEHFWDNVFNDNYKYISIRDMMVSNKTNRPLNTEVENNILNSNYSELYNDFVSKFPDGRERDLLHFFLKYRYEENWKRESVENYFPITTEELLKLIPDTYEVVYLDKYPLEWTKNNIKETFNYDIQDDTHIKILLKRKDYIIDKKDFRLNLRHATLDIKNSKSAPYDTYKLYGLAMRKSLGLSITEAIEQDFYLFGYMLPENKEEILREISEELDKRGINKD